MPPLTPEQARLLAEIIQSGGSINIKHGTDMALVNGVVFRLIARKMVESVVPYLIHVGYTDDGFAIYSAIPAHLYPKERLGA